MFESAASRYVLRCVLYGVGALASSLTTAVIPDGIDLVELEVGLLAGVGASITYAGLGALLPQVEPFVGRKKADPDALVRPNDL